MTINDALVLVQVFHKIITSGLPRLQPLYDCLLTVMVNGESVHLLYVKIIVSYSNFTHNYTEYCQAGEVVLVVLE